jgi:hypothetical protein
VVLANPGCTENSKEDSSGVLFIFASYPGMQVNAEIHLGTRTVLEYLLSPVQRVAHEAGRER